MSVINIVINLAVREFNFLAKWIASANHAAAMLLSHSIFSLPTGALLYSNYVEE